MSDSCARAVTLAIAALYDIAEQAGTGPVRPNLALRAAMALMLEAGKRDRRPFNAFWKVIMDPGQAKHDESTRNYVRKHTAEGHVAAIAKTFGMQPETQLFQETIANIRRQHRVSVDPEYRARMHMSDTLKQIKHVPRGMTIDEWENHKELGWFERPR